jgi:TRAP-type C4-dicarboxylate transport system permease small subunit
MTLTHHVRRTAGRVRAGMILALRHLIGAALLGVILLAIAQMVLRYIFAASLVWVEDLSVLVILSVAWGGGLLLWLERRHVAVTILSEALPRRGAELLRIGIDVIAIVFGIALVPMALNTADMFAGIDLAGIELDASVRYAPIVVGGFMLALGGLIDLLAPASPEREPLSHGAGA